MATPVNILEDIRILSHKIFRHTKQGLPRLDFLQEVSKIILEASGCDALEIWLKEGTKAYHCETVADTPEPISLKTIPCSQTENSKMIPFYPDYPALEQLCRDIIQGKANLAKGSFTQNGSFWSGDLRKNALLPKKDKAFANTSTSFHAYRSLVIIKLVMEDAHTGLLLLKSRKPNFFNKTQIKLYELIAQTVGFALNNQQTQTALHERVKELTCLYGISQICEQEGVSLESILRGIVEHLPLAWQYPEITFGRIILDGHTYLTSGFKEGAQKLTSEIVINNLNRGIVEVVYTKEKPELAEGPFLKEERSLIDAIAAQIALIVQRKQAEEDKSRLSEQLRHADRLATIGQLAAGVAHEINEPLGNILGFAQLAKKSSALAPQTVEDIEKIVKSALHAREIIKKLMLFARQTPPRKTQVNLNKVVEEGFYFLESRCAKEGIEVIRELESNLPEITADPAQLNQVLVNLVVNAVQAMPKGGKVTVRTTDNPDYVALTVEDTGMGMSEDVIKQIFIPFFTTKEVGQGTGLGLSVIHGIITAHGGTIKVASQVNQGSRFEIQIPKNDESATKAPRHEEKL